MFDNWYTWIADHWRRQPPNHTTAELIRICEHGMAEEMGEIMGCLKREIRGDAKTREELVLELGDMLHYTMRYMQLVGITPREVFLANRDKLVERYGE